MNRGLRNEFALVTGLAAAGFWLAGRKRAATKAALLGLGIRFLPLPQSSFRERSVVITGGSRGLGLALAEEFLRAGAKVALLARDEAELARAKTRLEEIPGARVLTFACDVTSPSELNTAILEIADRYQGIDVLVNNAGAISVGPLDAMEAEDFAAQMQLHYQASFDAMQAVLPFQRCVREGWIVNISSIGGAIPVPHMAPYTASKFALAGLSEVLGLELRRHGIRVLTVYPGLMRTGSQIQAVFKGDHEKEYGWFSFAGSVPGFSVSAETAAREIFRALENGKSRLVISVPAKVAVLSRSLFPEIFNASLRLVARFLPRGISRERRTGAESKAWLESQEWNEPLLALERDPRARFNQSEKFDGDYNLGIKSSGSTKESPHTSANELPV